MENHKTRRTPRTRCLGLGIWLGVIFTICVTASAVAQDVTLFSGDSTTIVRTTQSTDKNTLAPAYEYVHFSAPSLDKNDRFSFDIGGWGRTDLAYRTTNDYHNGDLQYGYFSYRAPKNNFMVNLGRQFITEGVASEKVDGLYLRSDLIAGLGAAAYVGSPVVSEPNSRGGDLIYGGRVTNSNSKYYTVGLSVLKVNRSNVQYREEEGVDVWVHPLAQVDLTGRSSYNSITGGWMEHDYKLSYNPWNKLGLTASYSDIKYKHYFYNMTTNAFSLFSSSNPTGMLDPNEKVQTIGGSAVYAPVKTITLAADYTHNHYYDTPGDANFYGGKATFLPPGGFVTGVAIHRMEGPTDKLRYVVYRVFASKKIQRFDLTADFVDTHYDNSISGVTNSVTLIGAASYAITPGLKFCADIDYSKNPYYSDLVSGMFKLVYVFDFQRTEGRAK